MRNGKMQLRRLLSSLGIALFTVGLFWSYTILFGKINGSIGLVVGMTTYSLSKIDLTFYLKYKAVTLTILAIFLGIMSYVASLNIWLGVLIHFITFFTVCFIYVKDFQSSISYLFLLMYIYMWATPVHWSQLGSRLAALLVGIVIIILAQFIVNHNKYEKFIKGKLLLSIKHLEEELAHKINHQYVEKDYMQIKLKLYEVLGGIGEIKNFTYAKQEKVYFKLWLTIERLNLSINELKNTEDEKADVEYIKKQIQMIKEWAEGTSLLVDSDKESINLFMVKGERQHLKSRYLHVIERIKQSISISLDPHMLSKDTLRFSYATRVATSVSLCMWAVDYWQIFCGKWLVFTSYVIMQPYVEQSLKKFKQRFRGTILGIIGYIIFSILVPYHIPKLWILIIIYTGYYYVKEYDKKVIFLSIMGLSVAFGKASLLTLSIDRMLLVILGSIVVAIVNTYIFHYEVQDAIEELLEKYTYLIDKFQKELEEGEVDAKKEIALIHEALYIMTIENQLMQYVIKKQDKVSMEDVYERSIKFSELAYTIIHLID